MSQVYSKSGNARNEINSVVGASHGAQKRLDLLLAEPSSLYHGQPGRFALCSKSGGGTVNQELFDVSRLEWVMRQIERMPERDQRHHWISQATLSAGARNRRISSIVLLNAVWCDVDLAHPPVGFAGAVPPGDLSNPREVDRLASLLALQIQDAGLPSPTYIVATGGGLCPKWVFSSAVPSAARARWQSLQNEVVRRIGSLTGELGEVRWSWPVDHKASDAARVLRLVGSHNPRWDAPCRIAWESGQQHEFDYLADEILQYTRAEVEAFRLEQAQWRAWDANRAAASAAGLRSTRQAVATASVGAIADEAARALWTSRFEFGRAVLESRGGVQQGSRNNHFWPLANALAWSCSSVDQLTHELAALHHGLFQTDGWTRAEAMQAAGTVMRRLKEGQLYQMRSATFLQALGVTPAERQAFSGLLGTETRHNRKRSEWSEGAMGFTPMRGLSLEDYLAETRRRQAEAGRRSAETRSTTHGAEKREQARQLASQGRTEREIAAALGVSNATAHRWCKA